VTRAELFESDAHREHVTFHDLRATGITWSAVRGDDPLRIKQRAGHKAFSTTEGYIREAENLREGFGEPFPTLPAALAGISASFSAFGAARLTAQPNFPGSEWSNGEGSPVTHDHEHMAEPELFEVGEVAPELRAALKKRCVELGVECNDRNQTIP
jgi:hypothetical protein